VGTVAGMHFAYLAAVASYEVVKVDGVVRKVTAPGQAGAYSHHHELAEGNFWARDGYLWPGSALQVQCEIVGE
jgi:hypothetical protein